MMKDFHLIEACAPCLFAYEHSFTSAAAQQQVVTGGADIETPGLLVANLQYSSAVFAALYCHAPAGVARPIG